MKKRILALLILQIATLSAVDSSALNVTNKQKALPAPPEKIAALHDKLDQEMHTRRIKLSATALGAATMTAYTVYALKQQSAQPQKRFVSDAIAATSLTASLLQGAAGCFAGAYGYYKVKQWLYDGYVKEKDLRKQIATVQNSFKASIDDQAEKINNHAEKILNFEKRTSELEAVIKNHAQDLNEGRHCARRTEAAINIFQLAINNHAQILKQLDKEANPTVAKTEPIIIPGKVQECAATILAQRSSIQDQQVATAFVEKAKNDSCFFCCK